MSRSHFEVNQRREWLQAIPKMIAIVSGLIDGRCTGDVARENGVRMNDVLRLKLEMEKVYA